MMTPEPNLGLPPPRRFKPATLLLFLCLAAVPSGRLAAETVLLIGATVHTVSGDILSPGQVLIKDTRIAAVGTAVPGDGATVVDLKGQHLYPGLIALNTVLGLEEIEAVRATHDFSEVGDYTPDVESWIAVNPDSELIPVARANGIACFEPVPQGGIVSGQSGLLSADGWTVEQRTIRKPVALHLFWPSMVLDPTAKEAARDKSKWKSLEAQAKERRSRLKATEDFFDEAKHYAKAKEAAAKGGTPGPDIIPAWEAMLPYVKGELPIMIHASEVRAIRTAVTWAATNHYKVILAGGRDAWMAADLLASNNVPVIYEHTYTQPTRDTESYDVHFRAPELLRQAGVRVIFSIGSGSFDAPLIRDLPYSAAQAVAFGLPEVEALKGITLYPAQIAGVSDRLGSIEAGKEATLFAADGNILDIRASVKRLWIAGKESNLESRHTRLYDRYKARPKENKQ
jgi:imidazolonepropionase-like amidohydrolase